MKRIYLASPYSHHDKRVREYRFGIACGVAAELMRQDALVFSPIAHSHPIATAHDLPLDFNYWQHFNHSFLREWATELNVIMMEGWQESKGVIAEREFTTSLNKPIYYISLDQYNEWRTLHGRKGA